MFTRCPACQTQFRVRAKQLSTAAGRVRCGACGEAFDAVSRLSDTPLPPSREPSAYVREADRPREPAVGDLHLPDEPAGDQELPSIDNPERITDVATLDWQDDETERQSRHFGRWLALALVLILIGLGQAAWFHRDVLYNNFPQLLPWAERLCEHIDCQVHRLRQTSEFEIINRDVRMHPVYKDALLVNATIANRASGRQPYPRIQLALFDTNGKTLAYREFAPADYLDGSLPVSAGMPADMPVHVVLEISGAAESAVSFEFGFL